MKHFGDITKLSGYELPEVDVITGGSPCQDLSVAGKRAGLAGERSGLFTEQIRIVREMRERDRANGRTVDLIRPRYMVWENVPGAYTSNGGRDFQAVLTEIIKISENNAPDLPMSDRGGRWTKAGCVYDEMGKWSIAWRLHDAQFWGVPQRRKRIALVADFGGLTAPEICFERKGLSWNIEKGRTQRENTTSTTQSGFRETICLQGNGIDRADTARCNEKGWNEDGVSYTLNTIDRPAVYDARGNGNGRIAPTITGDHQNRITDYTAITYSSESYSKWRENTCGATLKAKGGCYGGGTENIVQEKTGPLMASRYSKLGTQEAQNDMFVVEDTVRRLTPLECERLQGYPDGWTDIGEWTDTKGKKRQQTDAARYKALGNSIALPFWFWLLRRISAQYERPATLGSLFDGIGGFPLCWERCNGKGTAIWASEIEEFPIAVTKYHFPEGENGQITLQ